MGSGTGGAAPDSGYRVTTAEVHAAAVAAQNTADEVHAELNSLRAYVEDVQATWHGVSSNTFTALMTDFNVFATMLVDALHDISSGLNGNYVNYSETEAANIANLKTVNGQIPGANFA
jgi:WXG100 family type VII secretion target